MNHLLQPSIARNPKVLHPTPSLTYLDTPTPDLCAQPTGLAHASGFRDDVHE